MSWLKVFRDEPTDGSPSAGWFVGCDSGNYDGRYYDTVGKAEARMAKIIKYRAGQYQFPPPPVTHARWDEKAWIDFISTHGRWTGE